MPPSNKFLATQELVQPRPLIPTQPSATPRRIHGHQEQPQAPVAAAHGGLQRAGRHMSTRPTLAAAQDTQQTQTAPSMPSQPIHVGRRQVVLQGLSWPVLAGLLSDGLASLLDEKAPLTGSCSTCIGVVDGTLGSCSGQGACMSSYDDRPGHFIAPWAHEERGSERALNKIERAVMQAGGEVQERKAGYLYAVFESKLGTDDVEFLLPQEDTTVELRASSRAAALPDFGRIEKRFEQLRQSCGFETVTVLRNRKQILGVVESPWDTFGPTPPMDGDYNWLDNVMMDGG